MRIVHRSLRAERGLAECHRDVHRPAPPGACSACVVRIHTQKNSVSNNNHNHLHDSTMARWVVPPCGRSSQAVLVKLRVSQESAGSVSGPMMVDRRVDRRT